MRKIVAGLAFLAAATAGASASAATVITDVTGDPTFTTFAGSGAGTYGLELRGGRSGTSGDWEIGVGQQTSSTNSSDFNQGQFDWGSDTTSWAFVYDYGVTVANTASITLSDSTTSTTVSYLFTDIEFGNAIEVFAKRDAQASITELDGEAVNYVVGDDPSQDTDTNSTLLLQSDSFLDGFIMKGTVIIEPGGGSRNEVFVKAGNVEVSAVPLPAAAWMLIAGVGGLAAVSRRKTSRS